MSKLHIFLLIDPSLRFLLKKLANTKYVDAWELWWTQCKEPGYIYIQKENYTEYILSKPTEIIFSEIFRRCLQGNKSKELTLSRPSSLFIHRTRKTGSMHAPATCMTNALQPRHARISMLVLWQLGSTNIQILPCYCRLSLVLTTCRLYILRIHHYMFFSCRTLSIIT